MSLTITTRFIPDFYEGVPTPSVVLTAAGVSPGATLTWSLKDRNEQGVEIPLPEGLELSSGGVITGTPEEISITGPGTLTASESTNVLTISSVSEPPIYSGSQLVVGGNLYSVVSKSTAGSVHTITISGFVALGGHSSETYSIVPLGSVLRKQIIVVLQQTVASVITSTVEKEFVVTVLKLNSNEPLYRYFNEITDSEGYVPEESYLSIYPTLGTEQRAAINSLVESTVCLFDATSGTFKKYLYLPTFSGTQTPAM